MEQNIYELGIIIRADMDDEAYQAEMDRVRTLLDRFGATIEKEDKWGRRKLAYPIAKQTEGMYTFITFRAPSTTPYEVESRLRLMENVLRFLTINLNEAEDRKAKAKAKAPAAPERPAPVVEAPAVEEPAVAEEAPVVEEPAQAEEAPAAEEPVSAEEAEVEAE